MIFFDIFSEKVYFRVFMDLQNEGALVDVWKRTGQQRWNLKIPYIKSLTFIKKEKFKIQNFKQLQGV